MRALIAWLCTERMVNILDPKKVKLVAKVLNVTRRKRHVAKEINAIKRHRNVAVMMQILAKKAESAIKG